MGMLAEFREFALKGNVVDMAVGIVIGTAFGKIVSSLVNDIVMPPIGLALGGVKFTHLVVVLKPATGETAAVTINYGAFLQTVADFTIVAAAIFVALRAMNALRRRREAEQVVVAEAAPPAPSPEVVLLQEIRDLLAGR